MGKVKLRNYLASGIFWNFYVLSPKWILIKFSKSYLLIFYVVWGLFYWIFVFGGGGGVGFCVILYMLRNLCK